jgi:hypothetical protein
MLGIENVKKVVKFACDFTKEISSALSDGKFQWNEIFGFFDEIMAIPGVVKSFPDITKEISDLTTEEHAQLATYIQSEFDIPNDKVEAFIENSLLFALSAVALVQQWKDLKS